MVHNRSLDGLRGLAVMVVIAHHFELPFADMGYTGVDIFFVLSGYLITALIVKEWQKNQTINLKRFYIRRFLRLYPALLVFLAFFGFVIVRPYTISVLTYWANWYTVFNFGKFDNVEFRHLWSLSVEEQYYVLWPALLLFLLNRLSAKKVLRLTICLALLSAVLRFSYWFFTNYANVGALVSEYYFRTDSRLDGLLLGSAFALAVCFGLLPSYNRAKPYIHIYTAAAIAFVILITVFPFGQRYFLASFGFLMVAIAAVICISRITIYPSRVLTAIFGFRPLAFVGKISYGLYLWHYPIGFLIKNNGFATNVYTALELKLACTLGAVLLSYFLIEKPILKLKDRIAGAPL